MADLNAEGVTIQVAISKETVYGLFNDSLHFTLDEFQALTDEEVEAEKTKRIDEWVAFVESESAKQPEEPTEAELLAWKAELQGQIAEIDSKLNE